MSQQDFQILKSNLVNALTLVGGGRVNADALTAYAALYIAELDAFYRDERRVPTSLEAKAPVGAGLKEEARRGVESALLRLASRAFGGAGRTNLTSELEPYEAARHTLGIAKDEARKTLDYLVSLERRGPHALAPQPPPAQTPMRKSSKRATAATPRRPPLRDVNANTESIPSPLKKKSKKKAVPRSSGVTIQDQNAMAMLMSSTKRVDWTSRLTNENEEKPRILDLDVVGKPARKVKGEAKDDSSVSSSAPPAVVAVGKPGRKVTVKATLIGESKRAASASVAPAPAASVATSTLKNKVKVKVEAKDDTSAFSPASPTTSTLHVAVNPASSSSIATTSKADKIRVKSEKSTWSASI